MNHIEALLEKGNRELDEVLNGATDRAVLVGSIHKYVEVTLFVKSYLRSRRLVLKIKRCLRPELLFGPEKNRENFETIQQLNAVMMEKLGQLKERVKQ